MTRQAHWLRRCAAAVLALAVGSAPGCSDAINFPLEVCGLWVLTIGEWSCPVPAGFLDPDDNLGDEQFDVDQTGSNVTWSYTDLAGNSVTFAGTYEGRSLEGDLTVVTPGAARTLVLRLSALGSAVPGPDCVDGTVQVISDTDNLCVGEIAGFWAKIAVPCNGPPQQVIEVTCEVDFVILMDTSQSTEIQGIELCLRLADLPDEVREKVEEAVAKLPLPEGIELGEVSANTTLLGIIEDGQSPIAIQNASVAPRPLNTFGREPAPTDAYSCIPDNVLNRFGGTVPNAPDVVDPLEFTLNSNEDWGSALAILGDEFPWGDSVLRFVLVITDEGPENGGTGDDCGGDGDDEAIANAIAFLQQAGVAVSFVLGTFDSSSPEPCVQQHAQDVADATGGVVADSAGSGLIFDLLIERLVEQCLKDIQDQVDDILNNRREQPTDKGD